MTLAERFIKRKQLIEEAEANHGRPLLPDQIRVERFLSSQIDTELVEFSSESLSHAYDFELNVEVTDSEAEELIRVMEKAFDDEKFDNLIAACKKDVLSAIVGPFGLGRLVSNFDKNGGNVTTVHNAQEGVYARLEDEYDRRKYDSINNSAGKSFKGNAGVGDQFMKDQLLDSGQIKDAYTGKIEKGTNTSPDHIKSLSQYHKDGGFMQSNQHKADFATDTENLAPTHRSINQSLRDTDKETWARKQNTSGDGTNADHFGIVEKRFQEEIKKGEITEQKHLPSTIKKAKFYTSNAAKTGISEGSKMGLQQSLGLLYCEFFEAVLDEVKDIYCHGFRNGFEQSDLHLVLKERLARIAKRLVIRWQDAFNAFGNGFISGFLSNLVTVVINMFIRTGKRMVRIIREGFFSILKALKMLCFPPDGMTYTQAAHEASKLIAAGLVVVGGIALEQEIDTLIKATPLIEPFADLITTVLVGGLTGLATTFIVYVIDKIDVFKVNDRERHDLVMNQLESDLDRMFSEANSLLGESSPCIS